MDAEEKIVLGFSQAIGFYGIRIPVAIHPPSISVFPENSSFGNISHTLLIQ